MRTYYFAALVWLLCTATTPAVTAWTSTAAVETLTAGVGTSATATTLNTGSDTSTATATTPADAIPAAPPATNAFETPGPAQLRSDLDKLVFPNPSAAPPLCSDAVFIRRLYLDALGTLPTAAEVREFLASKEPDKRDRLINQVLQRPEFADYWAMKWSDILRIKAEFPVNLWPNAAQAYHRFIKASLAQNKPYDQFARELLTSSGSNFRQGAVNFYRALQNRTPEGLAGAVALTFMGSRVEQWSADRLDAMKVFFSQIGYKPTSEWKEEHVFWDPLGASTAPGNIAPGRAQIAGSTNAPPPAAATTNPAPAFPLVAAFPDGTQVTLKGDRDPREIFADWLIRPENAGFNRAMANRAWAWLTGRGIIHEPDDVREDNPPCNPQLLAYLEKELVSSRYDLRQLYRTILRSHAYQSSSLTQLSGSKASDLCATYVVRRLDAEVLSDALNKITGSSELYTSPIPEPFTYIPRGMPAVAIADGSITSPFLALFGRSARATGLDNEKNNKPTSAQALYLLNSSDIQAKIEQGTNMSRVIGALRRPATEVAQDLYLTILSRYPTPDELAQIEDYHAPIAQRGPARKPATTPPTTPATNAVVTAGTNALSSPGTNTSSASTKDTSAPAVIAAERATSATTNTAASAEVSAARPARKGRPLGNLGSRRQSAEQQSVVVSKKREDWLDVAWALINSEEFLYRH